MLDELLMFVDCLNVISDTIRSLPMSESFTSECRTDPTSFGPEVRWSSAGGIEVVNLIVSDFGSRGMLRVSRPRMVSLAGCFFLRGLTADAKVSARVFALATNHLADNQSKRWSGIG